MSSEFFPPSLSLSLSIFFSSTYFSPRNFQTQNIISIPKKMMVLVVVPQAEESSERQNILAFLSFYSLSLFFLFSSLSVFIFNLPFSSYFFTSSYLLIIILSFQLHLSEVSCSKVAAIIFLVTDSISKITFHFLFLKILTLGFCTRARITTFKHRE